MRRRQVFAKAAAIPIPSPPKLLTPSHHKMEAMQFKNAAVEKGVCPHCKKYIGRGVYTHWRGCRNTVTTNGDIG
jgi:hypothetical protein